MTTYVSREVVRDKIKDFYDTVGSWSTVYSGRPNWSTVAGESPIMTVLSDGSRPRFSGLNTNPLTHFYIITSWVLYRYDDGNESYTYDEAEDRIDQLYTDTLQALRDNAAGASVATLIQPLEEKSSIIYVQVNQSHTYVSESIPVRVHLAKGSL